MSIIDDLHSIIDDLRKTTDGKEIMDAFGCVTCDHCKYEEICDACNPYSVCYDGVREWLQKVELVDKLEIEYVGVDRTGHPEGWNSDYERGFQDAIERIIKIPAVDVEPKWIPCSERLPDKDGHYLVWTDRGVIDIAKFYLFADFVPEEISTNFWDKASEVIFWKQLPEPPRMDGDEDA